MCESINGYLDENDDAAEFSLCLNCQHNTFAVRPVYVITSTGVIKVGTWEGCAACDKDDFTVEGT